MAKSRRPNGTGNIYERNGKFIGRLRTGRYKPDGKPEVVYFSGKTKTEVQKKINKFDLQAYVSPIKTTFETYARDWMRTYKQPTLKASSFDTLENTFNNQIFPHLGMIRLLEITTKDVQDMINDLKRKGLSYSQVKKARDGVNMVMKHAKTQKHISENPVDGVVMPLKSQFNAKPIECFDENEARLIVEECGRRYPHTGTPVYLYGDAYILQLNTGARRGEIVALEKGDWDRERHTLHIGKSAQTVKTRDADGEPTGYETIVTTTKTYSGDRYIPLNEAAEKALQRLYDAHPNSKYIVCAQNGGMLPPQQYDRTFRRIMRNTKINKGGTHLLRHTFADMLVRNNVDPKTVSVLMGHANTQITLDTYVHFFEAAGHSAVKVLDKKI